MRVALGIEYDGSAFLGWQRQHQAHTVQYCLERSLSKVADHPVEVCCAGRTDRGVHALQQVVHFDTWAQRPDHAWILGGNSHLPDDVRILWAKPVDDNFHARFSALSRRYRYIIVSRSVRPAILRERVCWIRDRIELDPMIQASKHLIGEHDFTSFRAVACQAKHANRTIHQLHLGRHDGFVYLDVEANAFLYHMVRNIAGVLLQIGMGFQKPSWTQDLLHAKDRTQAGITAPAEGLYLVSVAYPEPFDLPMRQTTLGLW